MQNWKTGAGKSYISFELARHLEKKPLRTKHKQIETMLQATPTHEEIYEVQMTHIDGNFTINAEVSNFNKPKLISLLNPCYKDVIQKYSHLKGIQMNDNNEKTELPIHVIIGTSKYAQIKTKDNIRIENRGETIAKYQQLGRELYLVDKKQYKTIFC